MANVYYSSNHKKHNPRFEFSNNNVREYPEKADRIDWILKEFQPISDLNIIDKSENQSIERSPDKSLNESPDHILHADHISQIHSKEYIEFIQSIDMGKSINSDESSDEYAPTIFAINPRSTSTNNFQANLGKYFIDPSTPVMSGTYEGASSSVAVAMDVGNDLLSGYTVSIGLSRPPGHHASQTQGGGYCIFNNVAILAKYLSNHSKSVSILDIDFHHGNGTQEIFYNTDKVQYVSLHADTRNNYPFYWGHPDEKGEGPGLGFNVNLPIDNFISESNYLDVLTTGIKEINDYNPDVVLVSMGFDGYYLDPIAGLSLKQPSFEKIGNMLLNFPKFGIILEGGYHPDIGSCFLQMAKGMGFE